jgi:hypothetical protein
MLGDGTFADGEFTDHKVRSGDYHRHLCFTLRVQPAEALLLRGYCLARCERTCVIWKAVYPETQKQDLGTIQDVHRQTAPSPRYSPSSMTNSSVRLRGRQISHLQTKPSLKINIDSSRHKRWLSAQAKPPWRKLRRRRSMTVLAIPSTTSK